eukprot:Em0005g384a
MECTISGQDDPCMRRDCSGVKFTEDEVVKEDVAKQRTEATNTPIEKDTTKDSCTVDRTVVVTCAVGIGGGVAPTADDGSDGSNVGVLIETMSVNVHQSASDAPFSPQPGPVVDEHHPGITGEVICLSPRMQRSHFVVFLILPSIIHGASLNAVSGSCGNLSAVMTNISGTCYTSVLTIPTPQYFNGTTVMCRDGSFGTLIGSDTLNIQLASPPSAPTITSLISTYSDQLTVTWTSVPTATSYNVSINACVNTLVPIPSTRAPQYTFTGLTNNTVYTVSVVAINCAGSSSPATMSNRTSNGPAAPPLLPSATTPTPSTTTSDVCTAAVGIAVGVSVSVTFVVSFSMGVLVAYVLGYISRRSKESSHKPSSHADPATVYEVGTNKKMKGDAMEIDANTAYGSHVSSTVYDEVGNNKKRKGDAMEMNTNTAYGSHVS